MPRHHCTWVMSCAVSVLFPCHVARLKTMASAQLLLILSLGEEMGNIYLVIEVYFPTLV